ncbi:hypothetical protein [uncultured Clostridium sp.]|uniref:hypothetical protein n=1 Tax=uncultured Clostridium sp. TaxID=59620 RepID=UPI0032172D7B
MVGYRFPYADKTVTEIMCHGKGVAYGKDANISSMCTVFAESEIISLIGTGRKKEDIAFAIGAALLAKNLK